MGRIAITYHTGVVYTQVIHLCPDSELPSLLSRGAGAGAALGGAGGGRGAAAGRGSDPPPSPATDARDCSSDTDAPPERRAPPLDDDYLELTCNDDMDLF